MVYSMTGFGRAEGVVNGRQIVVEIKSLNGKQFEIGIKLPPILRSYELDIRNLLSTKLIRGSIDFNIAVRQDGASKPMVINTDLAIYYYKGMKQISDKLNLPEDNALSTIMRMPEVVVPESDVLPEEEFEAVAKVIEEAANLLMEHRKNEGEALGKDLSLRITNIEALLDHILPLEAQRTDKIRTRLNNSLRDVVGAENIDANRFEQELIYYIERMDFSEEKTRLTQHCTYFHNIINREDVSKGKKLGFILQEVGREINTLGAKANNADIQQMVIGMKDELEKAKEQVLNVL
ncbi:MAG TPA: YicC/YloC family endoribonuclease [Flavipsychrobacter sp.]|nr:YicC/YloC family endoribonuclease [Flavipsychrobacter sp.]